ncbi:tRNA 2-thiouridine(34) synthase MnmA [Bremerella cremea]|uniref:tRNA-specific 2-thiouridylase MnmA n=1 Tax=Bremerella cremea TaxID=1031537 RepID=A0A368KXQ5_9BACT|nr:tRNA 2-thiouridine(34) synthase MnmA [Bremerella cremea]RCS56001.1 tRNA 2-thiouridine(34) synthase MnmA [Bremerella cremea]
MARVVLAMSGGVDSSVAAQLLKRDGHDVIGVFMRHGEESPVAHCAIDAPGGGNALQILNERADHKQGCCSASDAADARRVADRMEIPFYALNLQQEFGQIMEYFADEYIRGRTPNPCVMCNNWIKFGKLFDYADSVGAEFVATGHYAKLVPSDDESGVPKLVRGVDPGKDQTYVLFGIQREYLKRMLLPVGDFHKDEIRAMAGETGLRVADKKDSQEICFVTSGKHDQFVKQRRPDAQTAGNFVLTDGTVVGQHDGIERFTIGQRKGLGIALGEPHYVTKIDPASNCVVLGKIEELGRAELTANRCNWLAEPPGETFRCDAMIRYNSPALPATVTMLPDNRIAVTFDQPRNGVAPGQAVVCYDGGTVLGGGWIE